MKGFRSLRFEIALKSNSIGSLSPFNPSLPRPGTGRYQAPRVVRDFLSQICKFDLYVDALRIGAASYECCEARGHNPARPSQSFENCAASRAWFQEFFGHSLGDTKTVRFVGKLN
jgi:hypothetical protein